MRNELENFSDFGTRNEIAYFLRNVIKPYPVTLLDLAAICAHAPGNLSLRIHAMLSLLDYLDFASFEFATGTAYLTEQGCSLITMSTEMLWQRLIERILDKVLTTSLFPLDSLTYDVNTERYLLRSERLPLASSAIRNVLIELGFMEVKYHMGRPHLEVDPAYESIISRILHQIRRQMTLNMLKKKMEKNEEAGELAEQYVLDYEFKRLQSENTRTRVRRVSEIDVTAGYDIVSFNSDESTEYDRFIEVKAVAANPYGFYWSNNEIETAKVLGDRYYLYLVELGMISALEYEPLIIQNPAIAIFSGDDWRTQAQTYYVQRTLPARG